MESPDETGAISLVHSDYRKVIEFKKVNGKLDLEVKNIDIEDEEKAITQDQAQKKYWALQYHSKRENFKKCLDDWKLEINKVEKFIQEQRLAKVNKKPEPARQEFDKEGAPTLLPKEELQTRIDWCKAKKAEVNAGEAFLEHAGRAVKLEVDQEKQPKSCNYENAALACNTMSFMQDLINNSQKADALKIISVDDSYNPEAQDAQQKRAALLTLAPLFNQHPQLKSIIRPMLLVATVGLVVTGAILLGLGAHHIGPSPDYVATLAKELHKGVPHLSQKAAEIVAPLITAAAGVGTGAAMSYGIFSVTGTARRANAATQVAEAGVEKEKKSWFSFGKKGGGDSD